MADRPPGDKGGGRTGRGPQGAGHDAGAGRRPRAGGQGRDRRGPTRGDHRAPWRSRSRDRPGRPGPGGPDLGPGGGDPALVASPGSSASRDGSGGARSSRRTGPGPAPALAVPDRRRPAMAARRAARARPPLTKGRAAAGRPRRDASARPEHRRSPPARRSGPALATPAAARAVPTDRRLDPVGRAPGARSAAPAARPSGRAAPPRFRDDARSRRRATSPPPEVLGPTRSSSPAGGPSRRRSPRAGRLIGCWSFRSAGRRWNGSSSTRRAADPDRRGRGRVADRARGIRRPPGRRARGRAAAVRVDRRHARRAAERGEPPFVLVLDSLEDPQNVGTLLRSAEAAGVHGVVFPTIARRRSARLPSRRRPAPSSTCCCARSTTWPGRSPTCAPRPARRRRRGGAPLTARQADLRGPLAIVVGSEGQGLGPAVRRRCDAFMRIPMRGAIGSLNAAVAGRSSSSRPSPSATVRSRRRRTTRWRAPRHEGRPPRRPATEPSSKGTRSHEPRPRPRRQGSIAMPSTAAAQADPPAPTPGVRPMTPRPTTLGRPRSQARRPISTTAARGSAPRGAPRLTHPAA